MCAVLSSCSWWLRKENVVKFQHKKLGLFILIGKKRLTQKDTDITSSKTSSKKYSIRHQASSIQEINKNSTEDTTEEKKIPQTNTRILATKEVNSNITNSNQKFLCSMSPMTSRATPIDHNIPLDCSLRHRRDFPP